MKYKLLLVCVVVHAFTYGVKAFNRDLACGSTKGCFGDCIGDGSSCTYLIAWKSTNTTVMFTIQVEGSFTSDMYVSFGLSPTQNMDDASVTACLITNGGSGFKFQNSYNYGHHNRPVADPTSGLSALTYTYTSNMVTCSFTRTNENADPEVFDLQTDFYIMFAKGPIRDGKIRKHHGHSISAKKVDLQSIEEANVGSPDRIKAHGTIAIIAWMTFMNLGAIIARHFRPLLPRRQVLGGDVWFLIHRILMGAGAILTIVAFSIIIKGSLKVGTTSYENSHPAIGITLLCIVIINPILGVLRPDKESKFRPVFYLTHYFLALLASIIGPINIFIGIQLKQAAVTKNAFFVLITHEILKVIMIVILEVILFKEKRIDKREEEYRLTTIHTNQHTDEPPTSSATQSTKSVYLWKWRKILLAVYISISLTFTLAMVTLVATSTSS